MINLVPRKEIPLSLTLTTTAVAVALTLIAGAAIFGVLGMTRWPRSTSSSLRRCLAAIRWLIFSLRPAR